MRVVKSLATVPIVLASAACATATAPEKTRASARIQSDVMDVIHVLETASGQSCDERKLVKTEVVKRATAENYSAVERWTIESLLGISSLLGPWRTGASILA